MLRKTSAHAVRSAFVGQGPQTSGRTDKEDLQVDFDEKEEVDDGPGHIRNVLHKRRARLKKKLKTLTSPPMKKTTREREGGRHLEPLKSNFLQRRSSRRDTFGDLRTSLTLPLTTSVLCSMWR